MALTPAREQLEHELRVEQMQVNIDKMRLAMQMEQRGMLRQTWSIVLSGTGTVVAAFAAGAIWWSYLGRH